VALQLPHRLDGKADAEEFGQLGVAVIVHGRDIVRDDDVSAPMAPGARYRTSFSSLDRIQERGK
jgi:hypothetical protein